MDNEKRQFIKEYWTLAAGWNSYRGREKALAEMAKA